MHATSCKIPATVQFLASTPGSATEKPSPVGDFDVSGWTYRDSSGVGRRIMKRSEALGFRIQAQQLDRPEAARALTDAAIFDFGIQDTGRDGASWALVNRGIALRGAAELEASTDVALAWTLRAAPHYYRRSDLAEILVATSPLSDKDAAKRVIGADKPLKAAGIPTLAGLAEVATQMRHVVTSPLGQG
jgi:hypothetical protein